MTLPHDSAGGLIARRPIIVTPWRPADDVCRFTFAVRSLVVGPLSFVILLWAVNTGDRRANDLLSQFSQ
jgi:hypothetical protein